MSHLNVLVSGAGIAGIVAAYWLGKAGINVTVIERTPGLRMSGQGIDIRGEGIEIVRQMGVKDEIMAKTTKEAGMSFVDDSDNHIATLGADGGAYTAEIEIIRADLVKILYGAAESTKHVKYEFGVFVENLSQSNSSVTVNLSNGETRQYDVVIGADGFGSRTRRLMLGPEKSRACINSLGAFVSYFTIPGQKQDFPLSRWYQTVGRRSAILRPKNPNQTSAYLTFFTQEPEVHDVQHSAKIETQKAFLREQFTGVKWEVPRILREMEHAGVDDFYMQEIGQIKLDLASWHQGRCVLAGDAAHCPSPFTGMGTTLAIVGAYVLAGEIVAEVKRGAAENQAPIHHDFKTAFTNYATTMGPFVKEIQTLPFGGALVRFLNPATWLGVWFFRTLLWFLDKTGLLKMQTVFEVKTGGFTLPKYQF